MCALLASSAALAQTLGGTSAPAGSLTLDQALQYALDHYPTIKAAAEQLNASAAGVDVARTAYLPRLDSLWQSNRGTANNVFGQVLPQSVIPALSGPVLASASGDSVWSSAVGALFTWEPFDFGLRGATVTGAEATVTRARATAALTQLDVESAVGIAFLAAVAAEQAVTAAQADVDRREVLARSVHALVDNQLRPGADASRIDAERAAARTRLVQVQAALDQARISLARLLGVTAGTITIDAAHLMDQSPPEIPSVTAVTVHPFIQVHAAAVDFARAQETVLARTDLPRVYLLSSVFARGSGASTTGPFDGGLTGLGLDRANWAVGFQVVMPNVFDFSSLHARQRAAAATERAEAALYDESVLTVSTQQQTAAVLLRAAREVAANTPVQLTAAQQSESQARARYDAGLASLVEVADTQNLLAQAEFQDRLAHVDIWRALLAQAAARGDLAPFVALLHGSGGR
ncbi:MAG TPA: TolC family protein [Vicinamibacterales bacterium]|nr:TolC family protein [Vicinamibacterales bacterium]